MHKELVLAILFSPFGFLDIELHKVSCDRNWLRENHVKYFISLLHSNVFVSFLFVSLQLSNTSKVFSPPNVIENNLLDRTIVKRKSLSNNTQNSTQKTKDWATQTPLKTGIDLMCNRSVSSTCSTTGHWWGPSWWNDQVFNSIVCLL
jgi:hypothetical protein